MNNATTTKLNCPQFSTLAQAFRISEAELLAVLMHCSNFLPSSFRLMLVGGKP